jgi:hypothetical protein
MEAIDDIIAYLRNAEVARCFAAIDDVNTMHHLLSVTADRIADARDGNAAALREALENAIARAEEAKNYLLRSADTKACMEELIDTASSALAAPARNCDLYATADEARAAYQSALLATGQDAFVWLYATAEGKAD